MPAFAARPPGTFASRHYPDDIPEEVKLRRLNEIINLQQSLSHESNKRDVGKRFEILVEGESKKNKAQYFGRNSQNKVIVFDNPALPDGSFRYQVGDYAMAEVLDCTPATLLGRVL